MNQIHGPVTSSSFFRFLPANPWFYTLLSCFILLVLLAARTISDFDLGFHLRGGQWILQNHSFPSGDVYTYTVAGHDYLDIHWLYQVILYGLYTLGGYSLLTIFNILLIIISFFITFRRLRLTGASYWVCVLLLSITICGAESRFEVRPEILSWVMITLILWVLDLRVYQNRNLLFLLPIIQLIWANFEGLFGVGWALMAAFLLRGFVDKKHWDKQLLGYSALSVVACLINPYFLRGALYPFSHLMMLGTSNVFKTAISELVSPWSIAHDDRVLDASMLSLDFYKAYSFFLAFLMAGTWRRRQIHEFFLVGLFFYLSTTAFRNISIFMLITAPVAASSWKDLSWGWVQKVQRFFAKPLSAWLFVVLIGLFCLRVVTDAFYISGRRDDRFGLGLDQEKQPVQATQFLVDNHLDGRILNQMNSGGWLDWKGPGKVFVDGRLEVMGEEFFKEYRVGENAGGLPRLVEKFKPDIIFFNPLVVFNWVSEMYKMPDWRLCYLDNYFAIFLRKDYAPQIPPVDYDRLLKERGLDKAIVNNAASILQTPHPSTFSVWLDGFVQAQDYPDGLMTLALFNYLYRQSLVSSAIYLGAIQRTHGKYYDFYLNFGSLLYDIHRYDLSFICEQRAIQDDPSNKLAHEILNDLSRNLH